MIIACLIFAEAGQANDLSVHQKGICDACKDDAEKIEFILAKAQGELQNMMKSKIDLRIDFIERFLKLEKKPLRKVRIFAKGFAKKWVGSFDEKFTQQVKGLLEDLDGSTFSVNGKQFTFEGEEPDEDSFMEINIKVYQSGGWLSVMVQYPNNGSGGGVSTDSSDEGFEESANYRKSLSFISDEDLKKTQDAMKEQRREVLVDSFVVLLDERLNLKAGQVVDMENWVRKKLGDIQATSGMLETLQSKFSQNTFRGETPEFLDEIQKESWRLLQHNQYPLGW